MTLRAKDIALNARSIERWSVRSDFCGVSHFETIVARPRETYFPVERVISSIDDRGKFQEWTPLLIFIFISPNVVYRYAALLRAVILNSLFLKPHLCAAVRRALSFYGSSLDFQ